MKVLHRRSSTLAGCVALLALGTVVAAPARASTPQPPTPPTPSTRAEISAAVHHDLSAPLWSLRAAPGTSPRSYPAKPVRTGGVTDSTGGAGLQPVAPTGPVAAAPATVRNFDGLGQGFYPGVLNVAPPDSIGAVGPNHFVQAVNGAMAVFNKDGTVRLSPRLLNTLWSGFGGNCATHNDGDPTVLYDPIADRWLISQFAVTTSTGLQCVAVSTTPDPTGEYFRYSFSYGAFNDYAKFGVWPDGYYATFNMFVYNPVTQQYA